MDFLDTFFGYGKELNILQMSCRGFVIFMLTLIFLRIAGRRSFGMRTPLDNIIVILLGAVLSRAIVGASPFGAVVVCCLIIVLLHRGLAWLTVHHKALSDMIQGTRIPLIENGQFKSENMDRALLCKKDLEQALHSKASTEDFSKVDKMYMEHNGEISIIKKA